MSSIWQAGAERNEKRQLDGNIQTDVLVIGGGMAGILCTYMLKQAGVDCVLAEAKRLCDGVTGGTTAKITLQHGLIYDKLIRRYGEEWARLYLQAQNEACSAYEKLCQGIDCDYEKQDAYVYSTDDRTKIEREAEVYSRLGLRAEFCKAVDLPFSVAGAVRVKGQAQFHPLKFAYAIAKEITVYESTKVQQLTPTKAVTDRGEIRYKKAVVATHFPIDNKHGGYFLKMYQHRSYVVALDGAKPTDGMFVDENEKGLSLRPYGDLLLLGGGAHRTGKQGGNWRELEAIARRYYPSSNIVAKWAAQDCITLDGVPYIGQYSDNTPDLYVATGFNKWGMTSSMVAARVLTEQILRKPSRYAQVFSPSRKPVLSSLMANAVESAVGLLTPTKPRCPHLGCALKYNAAEHSWDCPCHGSRFTEKGELLDNPATDDLRKQTETSGRGSQ